MGEMSLADIILTPLTNISTLGGNVCHGIKSTDATFKGVGEVYFSWIECNFIKAWKKHNEMWMNLIVPVGNVKFVFYDHSSQTFREEKIGERNYSRITVPPGVWFGFQGIDSPKSMVVNVSNILHNPNESDRMEINSIEYNWEIET